VAKVPEESIPPQMWDMIGQAQLHLVSGNSYIIILFIRKIDEITILTRTR
jgi:hypothetical protein